MTKQINQIPANRRLVDELYHNDKISQEAREYALDLLYPHNQWILWISRILLVVGASLLLSGVVFFFAFNWTKITPFTKFAAIEIAIAGCLAGAYFYSLERLSGKVLLLSASVLIGVFLAVFGQVYQTGADAYQLFMMWSLIIFGWVFVSNFAGLWLVWLVITNVALSLWWEQEFLPSRHQEIMIFTLLSMLNGLMLFLREYLRKLDWLKPNWTRAVLVSVASLCALYPIIINIFEYRNNSFYNSSLIWGVMILAALFFTYRYKIKNALSLSIVVLSFCVIVEAFLGKHIFDDEIGALFLMLILTLGLFTGAVLYLKNVIKEFKNDGI